MIQSVQQRILQGLAEAYELSDDVRVGQLLDFVAFLAKDETSLSLAEIEDEALLRVVENHLADLARRAKAAPARS